MSHPLEDSGHQLIRIFDQYFKILLADTPDLRSMVYRLRYNVYCQELGHESPDKFPDGLERDNYDSHSIHCLLLHRRTGRYIGCVRLVLSAPNHAHTKFPFEAICSYNPKEHREIGEPYAEVSRLAVVSHFRKNCADSPENRYLPLIAIGLCLAATSIAIHLGIESVFAVMEPRLARYLRQFGIHFMQISALFEFHGQRALYKIDRWTIFRGMKQATNALYQFLISEIQRSLPRGNAMTDSNRTVQIRPLHPSARVRGSTKTRMFRQNTFFRPR